MQIIALIILLIAYSIGVITVFLELVAYRRKVEYIETIFFTIAFLSVITTMGIVSISNLINSNYSPVLDSILLIALVVLALFAPLNVFAERQVKVSIGIKVTLLIIAIFLSLLVIANSGFDLQFPIEIVVQVFLAVSIFSSMLVVRFTKPEIQIKHREKQERLMAILLITVFPFFLLLEFFSHNIQALSFLETDFSITVLVFFIILAIGKIIDNLTRLSILRPDNIIESSKFGHFNLTQRETEVAELLIKGGTYAKIGETLFISIPTVKTHASNIYKKVNVKNKMELFYALS